MNVYIKLAKCPSWAVSRPLEKVYIESVCRSEIGQKQTFPVKLGMSRQAPIIGTYRHQPIRVERVLALEQTEPHMD